MSFAVGNIAAQPTLDHLVLDSSTGRRRRVVTLTGVLSVGPADQRGIRVFVRGQQPAGDEVGLYLPEAVPLPPTGEVTVVAEAMLAQVVVDARVDNMEMIYGIGSVAVQLVPDTAGQARWPYLSFTCYGGQPLAVRYRVTTSFSADPPSPSPA